MAGLGVELTHGVFRLELGLGLGTMLHVFTLNVDGAPEPLGSRADFVGRTFLRAVFNPFSSLLVWLQVGDGLSSRPREHRLLGAVLYSRGALWVDAIVGLGWET